MASEITSTHNRPSAGNGGFPAPRVFLQPISPPASFGLFGFFGSTMVLSTWILGWWGTTKDPVYFFTFNAAFGGIVQLGAGIWSFKARDYVASSLLTMWGTYWMGWGLLQGLAAAGVVTIPPLTTPQASFAMWFIPLGFATLVGALAVLSPRHGNFPLFLLLFTIGVGSELLVVGLWTGVKTWTDVAAWFFIVGACAAWYVGAMALLLSAWRRVIFPLGKYKAEVLPRGQSEFPTEYVAGMPGVRQGQA